MPELSRAYLQQSYRLITAGFLVAVGLTLGVVLYIGSVHSIVTVTPIAKTQKVQLTLTIGPAGEGIDLVGTVTQMQKSATVTAEPSSTGTPVPAQARGTVVIHNDSNASQALAVGTRLQAESGEIVRTQARLDVPAHGTVSVEAVADSEGTIGEIQPGRLTIVALRAANQAVIYGQVETAFTGGTTTKSGTLGVDGLTTASNQAQENIVKDLGSSQPGTFRTVIPDEVGVTPEPDEPSSQYEVSVTVIAIEATYDQAELQARIQRAVTQQLADDEKILSIEEPTIQFEQQPTSDSLTITVSATASTTVASSSPILVTSRMAGKPRTEVIQTLLATNLIRAVEIDLQPFWRTSLPSDPGKISVKIKSPAK